MTINGMTMSGMTMTRTLYNVLGYQAVWFAAVGGAGHGLWWSGPLVALAFAAGHFGWAAGRTDRAADLRLMAMAGLCGIVLDGTLFWGGLVDYRGDAVALPPGGAPLWILSMWMSFALTLRHSLGRVCRRPALAALLGAVFGPLAYLGAERGFDAAALAEPRWQVLLALGIGWALALWLLGVRVARDAGPHRTSSSDPLRSST